MSVLPSLNSIRVGLTVLVNGEPYQVLTANFVRMQQRKPVMQTKLRNLINAKVMEISFKPGDKVEEADMEKRKADYLYQDPSGAYFMDNISYEQFTLSPELLGDKLLMLKEGSTVEILNFNGSPITIALPPKIDLKVVSAPPGVKGDTAGNVTKPVTLETGLVVNAPLFIKEGESIRINTETGDYVERAN